jgi:hypothetical protein
MLTDIMISRSLDSRPKSEVRTTHNLTARDVLSCAKSVLEKHLGLIVAPVGEEGKRGGGGERHIPKFAKD